MKQEDLPAPGIEGGENPVSFVRGLDFLAFFRGFTAKVARALPSAYGLQRNRANEEDAMCLQEDLILAALAFEAKHRCGECHENNPNSLSCYDPFRSRYKRWYPGAT
jgi:hypothetical protein